MDSGWVQPYFFIDSLSLPSIAVSSSNEAYAWSNTPNLAYLSQTLFIQRSNTSSGYSYTTINPATIKGVPVFSRYILTSSSWTSKSTDPKHASVSGDDLVELLSAKIQSNITGEVSLRFRGFSDYVGSGTISLQAGEITGGNMNFYSSGSTNKFKFTSDWWIS